MAAHQAPPSLGFSRQEYWSGLPFPPPMHESEKWKWSRSVVSDLERPHGLQPIRLLRPWDFTDPLPTPQPWTPSILQTVREITRAWDAFICPVTVEVAQQFKWRLFHFLPCADEQAELRGVNSPPRLRSLMAVKAGSERGLVSVSRALTGCCYATCLHFLAVWQAPSVMW